MFNDHYEVPSSIYFCPCLNLVLSAFISVLRLKFLIAYLTSLQTFFYAYRASKQFILSFQNLQPFSPIFLIPSPLQKNNGLSLLTMNRSIWLTVFPFGDLQLNQFVDVSVGEPQRPTTHFQLFLRQNSTSPSPLSLMVPRPCWPIASSLSAGVVTLNFSFRIRGNQ